MIVFIYFVLVFLSGDNNRYKGGDIISLLKMFLFHTSIMEVERRSLEVYKGAILSLELFSITIQSFSSPRNIPIPGSSQRKN